MASGTITGSRYGGGHYGINITWSSTANQDANTSSVTVRIVLWSDYSINYTATKDCSTTINGSTSTTTTGTDVNHGSSGGSTTVHTRTVTVAHDDDGTKSISVSAWLEPNVSLGTGGGTSRWNASGTIKLDNIPRGMASVYTGSSWQKGQVYVHNGSGWQKATGVFVHNGSGWQRSK